jgi:hypothetical protein
MCVLSLVLIAMKPISATRWFICALLVLAALCVVASAGASTRDSDRPHSQAIAHLTLSGKQPQRMFLRQAGKTHYLYVEQPSQQGFTVIDVTRPSRPRLVKRPSLETLTVMGSGIVVTATPDHPANMNADDNRREPSEPLHVINVSGSAHPPTVETFRQAISVLTDDSRGLIYVLNSDGIWILSTRQVLREHSCSSSDAISPLPNCN